MNERIKELQAEQEQFDMDDHPPHRLCECRKCMEYFTPLPDCDAFAAFGKPIAEQEPVAVVGFDTQSWRNLVDALTKLPDGTKLYAEPANKTEEKPLLVQAWEKRFAEQAEQEPVAIIEKEAGFETEVYATGHADSLPDGVFKLYAAPVRTKDLTDDEIRFWIGRFPFLLNEKSEKWVIGLARAIIAADREKNK